MFLTPQDELEKLAPTGQKPSLFCNIVSSIERSKSTDSRATPNTNHSQGNTNENVFVLGILAQPRLGCGSHTCALCCGRKGIQLQTEYEECDSSMTMCDLCLPFFLTTGLRTRTQCSWGSTMFQPCPPLRQPRRSVSSLTLGSHIEPPFMSVSYSFMFVSCSFM